MFIFWYVLSCLESVLSYLLPYLDFIIVPFQALVGWAGAYIGGLINALVAWLKYVTRDMTPEHAALAYGAATGMVAGLPLGGMALLSAIKVAQAHYRSAGIIIVAVTVGDVIVAASSMALLHIVLAAKFLDFLQWLFNELPEFLRSYLSSQHWLFDDFPGLLRKVGAAALAVFAYKVWRDAPKDDPMKSAKGERDYFLIAFGATVFHPGSWTTYLTAYGVLLPNFDMLPIAEMGFDETCLQLVANTLGLTVMTFLFLGLVWLVFYGIRLLRRSYPHFFSGSEAGGLSGFLNRYWVGRWLIRTGKRIASTRWGMVMSRVTSVLMVLGGVALIEFKT